MTWLVTAVVVTGAITASSQIKAGKEQKMELEVQADQEKVAAEGRELARREQLNKALAQSVIGQSISGISGEGTPQSIALANAKTAALSEGMEDLSTRLRQAYLKRQGQAAKQAGNIAGVSTLLKSGVQAGQLG